MHRNRCSIATLAVALLALILAPTVGAQELTAAAPVAEVAVSFDDAGVFIDQDVDDLATDLRPSPDPDFANTALVLTNLGNRDAKIVCVGFDKQGHPVGRAWVKIPSLGLRYVLASQLSNGTDFIGHAQCGGNTHKVKASAVFLGPGFSDLPVLQARRDGRIRFLLIAHY